MVNILIQKFGPDIEISSGSDAVPLELAEYLKNIPEIEKLYLQGGLNFHTDERPWIWEKKGGYTLTEMENIETKRFYNIRELEEYLYSISEETDVIHAHTRGKKLNEIDKKLKEEKAIPIIYTMHGMDGLTNPFDKEMFELADLITTPSLYAAEKIVEYFPEYKNKVLPVPNSTDFTKYTYDEEVIDKAKKIRERYAPNGEKLILISGRLQEDKGVFELGEAIVNLLDQGENIKLMHSGIIFSEEDKRKLEEIFEKKGYRDRLILNGKVPEGNKKDLAAIYKAADIFVLPSDGTYENMSVSLLEALAMEVPSIASAQGGTYATYIKPGMAIGIKARNVKSIEKGIKYVLQNYDKEKERARRARQIIWKFYNSEFVSKVWAKIYEKLDSERLIINDLPASDYPEKYYEKICKYLNVGKDSFDFLNFKMQI